MSMKSNYGPNDLAFYTTWWLTPTPSISSKTTLSVQNSIKSDNEHSVLQSVMIHLRTEFDIPLIILEYPRG